ncbi:glycosyl transferase family 2, partial [Lactiplantibacillus plantarum]|nr:glycosyl transferase family 2 [Lactiplantibacillus plantarum]
DVPGYEDYELWLRVLNRDAMAISNLPQVLVAARVSGLQSRRGGFKYVLQNIRARSLFFDEGLISLKDLIVSIVGGTVVGLCPEAVRKVVYKKVLRG